MAASRMSLPLAEQLRPRAMRDVVGQAHLVQEGGALAEMEAGRLFSFVLWGPPGSGKTTLVRLLARRDDVALTEIPALSAGLAEFRRVFAHADKPDAKETTLLFIDEIHRLNRTQQDAFLSPVETGRIILAGATTENPSFALTSALLSRARVFVLERLDDAGLETLLKRAEAHLKRRLPLDDDTRAALREMADGDARFLFHLVEAVNAHLPEGEPPVNTEALVQIAQKRAPLYDRDREEHYNLISALHKSVRGSDVDAALYWLARMLAGGEDPLYIARRLVRMASEDIGMADPHALPQTIAARDAYAFLGTPEGELALAQAVVYLATAPKSNAAYKAFGAARAHAKRTGSLMPPKHSLNAPTQLMKDLNYGKGYAYDHAAPQGFSGQDYFPEGSARETFYTPRKTGFEREIIKRLTFWERLRAEKGKRDV